MEFCSEMWCFKTSRVQHILEMLKEFKCLGVIQLSQRSFRGLYSCGGWHVHNIEESYQLSWLYGSSRSWSLYLIKRKKNNIKCLSILLGSTMGWKKPPQCTLGLILLIASLELHWSSVTNFFPNDIPSIGVLIMVVVENVIEHAGPKLLWSIQLDWDLVSVKALAFWVISLHMHLQWCFPLWGLRPC